MTKHRWRLLAAVAATLAIVVPLAWMWQASRMPDTYSVMDMGYVDYGGGPELGHGDGGHGGHGSGHDAGSASVPAVSVEELVEDTDRDADVEVDLVAAEEEIELASGRTVDGYTLNGTSPGPTIRVREGQLLEVRVRNESVDDGIALHWHGVDVPNAEDGVAGVTQDAVGVGEEHTYRWVADQAGTYWYHSHQVSHRQVVRGLYGALVVEPRKQDRAVTTATEEVLAVAHTYSGRRTLNGEEGDVAVPVDPGSTVRVRVVNTDNGPVRTWTGAPYRVLAIDATDVNEPTPVEDRYLTVTAGGRADLEVTVPADGRPVRVQVGSATALVLGPEGAEAPAVEEPEDELDLLSYGSPADLGFSPADADRSFDYHIGRRPGFLQGKPGLWWTINGHMWPDVPMFMVAEGDVVTMEIDNSSGDVHPMHLHGHHAVVLSRNGQRATGSPWWFDSLNVKDGERFEIAFVADNPGVWMDHCHNLQHARDGLVAHLMYAGVTTPFEVGGDARNEPE
ncbi:multicopper oxidase family protein [Nocardioides caldifontis]|uniref:multicopper oxidase family protein n=1 Tax=Nocardioides caldifontis TaxID=2588938 RepID=UPI001EEFF413|nr:multicopper oxidase family protein [Nocardioides caldifontis]